MLKSSIIYLLIFSFLLAGCYTTSNFSDTPQNIRSGKSKIELNGDYILDSLTLKDGKIVTFKDSFSEFLDCNKDSCSKLAVGKLLRIYDEKSSGYMYSKDIIYKKSVPDTIEVSKISLMHYSKNHFNQVPFAVGGLLLLVIVIFFYEVIQSLKHLKLG
jgi:hypothetical protein